jgi:hypothetical protein
MSNHSAFFSLVRDIKASLGQDGPSFEKHFHESIGSVGLEILLSNSLSRSHVIHSLSTSLEFISSNGTSKLASNSWNPIISLLVDFIDTECSSSMNTPTPPSKPVRGAGQTEILHSVKSAPNQDSPPKSFSAVVKTAPVKSAPIKEPAKREAKTNKIAAKAKLSPRSSTPTQPLDMYKALAIRGDLHQYICTTSDTLYPRLCNIKGRCTFCRETALQVAVTSCASIHGGKPCHPSKWFPHLGIKLASCLKKPHDSGRSFTPKEVVIRDDLTEMKPLSSSFGTSENAGIATFFAQQSSPKRKKTHSRSSAETIKSHRMQSEEAEMLELHPVRSPIRIGEAANPDVSENWGGGGNQWATGESRNPSEYSYDA